VEKQLFSGAGAVVFRAGSDYGFVNLKKDVTKSSKFFIRKFEVKFKNYFFVAI
jgi:hypothetical protein